MTIARVLILAAAAVFTTASLSAQVTPVPQKPVIGSSNPVSAEPPVARPSTTPCTVQLFTNLEFADFNVKSFSYAPPSSCPGPWAKVVFTADFTVTAGVQFDRTGMFLIGGAPIYFGTTAEPSPSFSPSWHVEKDVTDYTALLESAQTGAANLGNFVGTSGGVDYDGLIYANAALQFYPVPSGQTAPTVPDMVIPIPEGADGPTFLGSTTDSITQSLSLPRNIEKAYLDVYAQSQSDDEFWWSCVTSDIAAALGDCGGTAFRETEISLDGYAVAAAPIYPWLYTGADDPNLWVPLPGVQTLDFKPFRVDLTPFASKGNDGKPHTIGISVFNADSGFNAIGTLFLYQDKGSSIVTGAVTENSIQSAPTPHLDEQINQDSSGDITGYETVAVKRNYTSSGFVNTSHGKVTTSVHTIINFSNTQNIIDNASEYLQNTSQQTSTNTTTTVTANGSTTSSSYTSLYPFTFNIKEVVDPNTGDIDVFAASNQIDGEAPTVNGQAQAPFSIEEVQSSDELIFDSNFNYLGSQGGQSMAAYEGFSGLNCTLNILNSANYVLTSVTTLPFCVTSEVSKFQAPLLKLNPPAQSPSAGSTFHSMAPLKNMLHLKRQ